MAKLMGDHLLGRAATQIQRMWRGILGVKRAMSKQLLDKAENIAKEKGHNAVYMEWELKNTPREVLQWYLDLNSGVAHTKQELDRVGNLLLDEINK